MLEVNRAISLDTFLAVFVCKCLYVLYSRPRIIPILYGHSRLFRGTIEGNSLIFKNILKSSLSLSVIFNFSQLLLLFLFNIFSLTPGFMVILKFKSYSMVNLTLLDQCIYSQNQNEFKKCTILPS